jgi:hypothetical protein
MALAMSGRGFGPSGNGVHAPQARPVIIPKLREGDVHIGDAEDTLGPIGIDFRKLMDGRLLVQGTSGAGKSWTLRRLLEQTSGLVQQIVIDPEGEFGDLGDKLGLLRLEAHRLDIATLAIAASRAREHRASVLLDLSDLDRDDQMKAAAAFFAALVSAPRQHWHPVLVAVDEAHLFAPFGGYTEVTSVRKAAVAALTDLMSRGRKRGLAGVLATQRLARLAKSVASEVHNMMVGLNTLDIDIRRAAEAIGWDPRKGFDRLPLLTPGEFVAVGPAFSRSPVITKVGPVRTQHRGAAPKLSPPAAFNPRLAAQALNLDELLAASAADEELRDQASQAPALRQIRAFIREPAFADAGRVWAALKKLAPEGARIAELAKHLNRSLNDTTAAIALLDTYGTLEFIGSDDARAVRIGKGMR